MFDIVEFYISHCMSCVHSSDMKPFGDVYKETLDLKCMVKSIVTNYCVIGTTMCCFIKNLLYPFIISNSFCDSTELHSTPLQNDFPIAFQ